MSYRGGSDFFSHRETTFYPHDGRFMKYFEKNPNSFILLSTNSQADRSDKSLKKLKSPGQKIIPSFWVGFVGKPNA